MLCGSAVCVCKNQLLKNQHLPLRNTRRMTGAWLTNVEYTRVESSLRVSWM